VQPTTEDFGAADPSLNVQLKALGQYIHPPVTKDITSQVVWSTNTPQVAVVSSTGLLSPGGAACGNALIFATVQTNHSSGGRSSSGALITGQMTANVACAGSGGIGGGGGGGTSTLSVDFAGSGSGTISTNPPGLGCASQCAAPFATGSSISITATPSSGSSFGTWVGCDSTSGQTCSLVLNNSRTVTVTFN
jgi:List-Bact-rpt repeat protein